ncbi:GNAT family N-acetyltransferase [Methylobacterium terricola]|uniref:GNAT family N-acetyltransferase n=1 Tax=Methylobacterium terricola TaxID=2583531 RepID=A0A5C4LRN4_9HYPH|nr:GNAT family N-acetyltransferase [Methylobacterium terricola]
MDYRSTKDFVIRDIVHFYKANGWSSAQKPELLQKALRRSENVISAWDGDKLIGLGNAISDGFLVVYYPHLLVLPDYHGIGVGKEIIRQMKARYEDFHQHMIIADADAVGFYRSVGFSRAGETVSMWIYEGNDHPSIFRGKVGEH